MVIKIAINLQLPPLSSQGKRDSEMERKILEESGTQNVHREIHVLYGYTLIGQPAAKMA